MVCLHLMFIKGAVCNGLKGCFLRIARQGFVVSLAQCVSVGTGLTCVAPNLSLIQRGEICILYVVAPLSCSCSDRHDSALKYDMQYPQTYSCTYKQKKYYVKSFGLFMVPLRPEPDPSLPFSSLKWHVSSPESRPDIVVLKGLADLRGAASGQGAVS